MSGGAVGAGGVDPGGVGAAGAGADGAVNGGVLPAGEVERVCVFAQLLPDNGLGDLLMRNILFALVRRRFPGARTTLVVGAGDAAGFAEFLRNHALVDDVLPCPDYEPGAPDAAAGDGPAGEHEFLPCPQYDQPPPDRSGAWAAFLDEVGRRDFQVCVLDVATVWLHAKAAHDAGIPTRIGLLRGHPEEPYLTASAPIVPRNGSAPDLADFVTAYAAALGVSPPLPGTAVPRMPFLPEGPGLALPRPRVALHVGGRPSWNRRWPLEKYIELCAHLLATRDCSIVLVGTEERAEHRQLLAGLDGAVRGRVCEIGAASLARTATVLSECDLFAGTDSGPMHLAAALGLPTVTLYGPDDSDLFWGSVYPDHHPIARHWPCSLLPHTFTTREHASCEHRCRYAFRPEAPEYPRCVADITVDEVLAEVTAVLDRVQPGASSGYADSGRSGSVTTARSSAT